MSFLPHPLISGTPQMAIMIAILRSIYQIQVRQLFGFNAAVLNIEEEVLQTVSVI